MLPGTIQQDQDLMPPTAPQMAPPVSPVPMPQMLGQMSPYIGAMQAPSGPSVLDTPEINAALKAQTLAQIQALGNNSSDKRDRIRNIFTGIMAPAMAMFGGAGSAAAAADMIQQSRQQAVIGRQQSQADSQHAAAALKGLVDIENTIRLKPLGMMLRDQRQAESNKIKADDLQRKKETQTTRAKIQQERNRILEENYKRTGDLRSRGLDIKVQGLEQAKAIADQRDHTLREIAVLKLQERRGIPDQNRDLRLQQLQQQYNSDSAKLTSMVETRNQQIRADIDKHNNLVRQKGAGELLNADQYMLDFNGVDPVQPQEEPDDSDYQAALQAVMQPTQAQPAQQGQAPAAPPQQNAQAPQTAQKAPSFKGKALSPQTQQNLLQKVQQRYGMNFQQATEYLRANGLM